MTMIYVNTEKNRFSIEQRRELAQSLTDAVLIPEIGQYLVLEEVFKYILLNEKMTSWTL